MNNADVDCVPIFRHGWKGVPSGKMAEVLRISLPSVPIPDDASPWQDILDFKTDMHEKQWHFRRFLQTMVTKDLTEAEIRDDIEWSLNEYSKAMELHRLKSSNSFLDVFVVTPLEIIENLIKFNWSKIARGAVQVRKRKVELMEAELKATGRECAYVFEARNRFGRNRPGRSSERMTRYPKSWPPSQKS